MAGYGSLSRVDLQAVQIINIFKNLGSRKRNLAFLDPFRDLLILLLAKILHLRRIRSQPDPSFFYAQYLYFSSVKVPRTFPPTISADLLMIGSKPPPSVKIAWHPS